MGMDGKRWKVKEQYIMEEICGNNRVIGVGDWGL